MAKNWPEVRALPRPELNPLVNPTLGRNLGRWAQVYFTAPPEKRDQAVSALLRELENEAPAAGVTQSRPEAPPKSSGLREEGLPQAAAWPEVKSQKFPPLPGSPVCPNCGSNNAFQQRFCGKCGSSLSGDQTRVGVSATGSGGFPAVANASPMQSDKDMQWLREKALSSFDEYQAPSGRGRKHIIAILVLALGGFAYYQWGAGLRRPPASSPVAAVPSAGTPGPQASSAPSQPLVDNAPPPRPVEQNGPAVPTSSVVREEYKQPKHEYAKVPSAQLRSEDSAPSTQTAEVAGGGAQELQLAQRYLTGSAGMRNTPEAVKLLWKAVGKQNASAAVLLSDLYMRGDGVPKSCDQARLLLVAAAKRGAANAGEQLRTLESNGCR